MSQEKQVTIAVHRAVFLDEFDYNLSVIIERIRKDLPSGHQVLRRELFSQTAVGFPSFPQTNEAIALQLALFEEGGKRSLVSTDSGSSGYQTSEINAPSGAEFLSNEVALLVSGNFVITCALGNRHALFCDAIGQLADACSIPFPPGCMSLAAIPNRLTLERIQGVGVSAIRFDAGDLQGSVQQANSGLIRSIFAPLPSDEEAERQSMVTELNIRPANKKHAKAVMDDIDRNQWVTRVASQAHETEEVSQYTIVLEDGSEWRDGELKLKRSVKVDVEGSSYNVPQALQHMMEYLSYLRSRDLIE